MKDYALVNCIDDLLYHACFVGKSVNQFFHLKSAPLLTTKPYRNLGQDIEVNKMVFASFIIYVQLPYPQKLTGGLN